MSTETENGLQQETEAQVAPETQAANDQPTTETATEPTTEAEPTEATAEPEETEKPAKRKEDWRDRRFKQENAKRHEAERQLAALEARIRAMESGQQVEQPAGEKPLTQADIEREAERIVQERTQRQQIARSIQAGEKEFGKQEFTEACNLLADLGANERPEFLHAIADEDNSHKILQHLGQNPDEAERILGLPALQMAKAVAKLSVEIDKPKAPAVSKAPTPIKPIDGRARTEPTPEKMNDAEFDKFFAEKLAARGR